MSVTIVVDDGEMRSSVPRALERIGADIEVTDLAVADYLVARGVGIERKTVDDLHRSIASGRIWPQLLGCRRSLDRTYLLVEGARIDRRGGLSKAGVRGALLEIGDRGMTIVRAEDAVDSALWIARIASRLQRTRGRGVRGPRRHPVATGPQALLEEVPGIGPKVARSLLERFDSILGVASADASELIEVPGVGPRRASMLRRVLADT